MSPRRRCKGRTRKGKRCKAAPLKTGDYCSAHDPNRPDETRFGSPEQASRAGAAPKPHQPRVVDVIRERIEREMGPVIGALIDALAAERGIVVGSGEDATLEFTPDHDIRIKAARELLDRAYGRPRTPLEHAGPGGGPIEHAVLDPGDPEVRRLAHELLERRARPAA